MQVELFVFWAKENRPAVWQTCLLPASAVLETPHIGERLGAAGEPDAWVLEHRPQLFLAEPGWADLLVGIVARSDGPSRLTDDERRGHVGYWGTAEGKGQGIQELGELQSCLLLQFPGSRLLRRFTGIDESGDVVHHMTVHAHPELDAQEHVLMGRIEDQQNDTCLALPDGTGCQFPVVADHFVLFFSAVPGLVQGCCPERLPCP